MCDRLKICIGISATLSLFALIASAGLTLTPFWWKEDVNGTHVGHGLFVTCEDPYEGDRSCEWGLEDIGSNEGEGL